MALEPLYPGTDALPILSDSSSRYRKLKTAEERKDQLVVAELLLGLSAPVYTGQDGGSLMYAIALQVNFQMDQGQITAQQLKSEAVNAPGTSTTSYRDRYLHPGAVSIVNRVTKTAITGFVPMAPGT